MKDKKKYVFQIYILVNNYNIYYVITDISVNWKVKYEYPLVVTFNM